jgi:hypothetical protein
LEEVVEMLLEMYVDGSDNTDDYLRKAIAALDILASGLKQGTMSAGIPNRVAFLDSLADQIVTAVGVGYCGNMAIQSAVEEVNRSNWSKFNYKGFPGFNKHGKIAKGDNYSPPNLEGMV